MAATKRLRVSASPAPATVSPYRTRSMALRESGSPAPEFNKVIMSDTVKPRRRVRGNTPKRPGSRKVLAADIPTTVNENDAQRTTLPKEADAQHTTLPKEEGQPNNAPSNGHLSLPAHPLKPDSCPSSSRSPSPLGVIPIHTQWRSFIHRHEVPRKVLHTCIGFLTLGLYASSAQPSEIHPVLLALLIPIVLIDVVRLRFACVNKLYIRVVGALMRESEFDTWNGVISYLMGAWVALRLFSKDIGVVAVLLLSWCDTAASTAGRRWGRYTPKVRRGKSLAGSLAALLTGVATAAAFYGCIVPRVQSQNPDVDSGDNVFAFRGHLALPPVARAYLGLTEEQAFVDGNVALAVMSVVAGVIASVSEAIDLWGLDDNVTIPVLCAGGLWGFLTVFA